MTRPILYAGITLVVLALGGCKDERERPGAPDRDKIVVADRDRPGVDDRAVEQAKAARDELVRESRAQLEQLNARLEELEDKADAESKEAAAKLRERRDDLAARIDRAEDVAQSEWEEFKADLDQGVADLRKELDERF